MVSFSASLEVSTTEDRATAAGCATRRRIDPRSGRALEILGHAIEYLTDEHVHRGGELSAQDADVEAIQILMAANREIYLACPEVPSLGERFRKWLGLVRPCN